MLKTSETIYKPVREGMRFTLKLEGRGTVLSCDVRKVPGLDISTLRFKDVISGHWSWNGDRESPV